MRKIGFVLLIAGFLWLCWAASSMRPIARAVIANHYDRLPRRADDAQYSRDEVVLQMREVTFDAVDHIQSVFIPACIMLTGGFLLGFAKHPVKTHTP
jgi:hypothetical protein